MLKPLENWFCDSCNQVIADPGDGWVEWFVDDAGKNFGFKILHTGVASPLCRAGCYYYAHDRHTREGFLIDFLGVRGLVQLYRFLDVGPYHSRNYKAPDIPINEIRSFVEFWRRLTIPFYEEARLYWDVADGDGFFDGMNEILMYLPETCEHIVKKYAHR
jgi:hypothetical protein